MAAAATRHPQKMRWGELDDEDDDNGGLDYLLPPPVVIGPDDKGIKKVIEYRFDEEGNKVKVTTTKRVLKVARTRVTKGAIERRSWPKFGDAVKEDAGSRLTMVSTEVIRIEGPRAPGSKAEDTSDDPLAKANNTLMVCRTCLKRGEHWTHQCPYKDLAAQSETFVEMPPTADDSKPSGDARKSTYVNPFLREGGAGRSGAADVMRRRNDENSVRVNNLSEDTTEADLRELFNVFGHVTRVYVAVDRQTGSSRGFGFVNFQHRQDAEQAIARLNGHGYDNLILRVEWANPRPN
ncbi:hypothetical protein EJB05_20401 [Eragrostis curvula]|uniref:Eukaryotic translation initiation factor 3 subunit G n=1 Tax=Eragrostis curvula TaxID=38414 RepID=A0A5J9UZ26_9POAL|nr:hypothetical protein EJB05_20401 [Eragrostis curvula]